MGPRRRSFRLARRGLIGLAVAALGPPALAATDGASAANPPMALSLDFNLSAGDSQAQKTEGATNDGGVIASLRPALAWRHEGPGMTLDLRAALTLQARSQAADGQRSTDVWPELRARTTTTLVEQWIFLDADAALQQAEVDPYGTREHDSAGANRRTEGSYRLSPYVAHQLSPDTAVYGRYDLALETRAGDDDAGRTVTQRGDVRLERLPLPLGGALQWSGLHAKSRDAADSELNLQTLRAIASASPAADLVLSLVAGQDRSRYLGTEQHDGLAGAELRWDPSPRSALAVRLEHRFFGLGGEATLRHRTPLMAFGLSFSRQPVLATHAWGAPAQGDDLRGLLDTLLASRVPDATERSGQVEQLIASRGLETRATGPGSGVADYPQLQSLLRANWTLLGARHVMTVTIYAQTLRQLRHTGEDDDSSGPGLTVPVISDSRQHGGMLALNRQLSPLLAADLSARWSRIRGLAERQGDVSSEQVYRFALLRRLSPRSSASLGVQHTRFRTNVQGLDDDHATLVFVGLSHFF